jgi:hypothetical protein
LVTTVPIAPTNVSSIRKLTPLPSRARRSWGRAAVNTPTSRQSAGKEPLSSGGISGQSKLASSGRNMMLPNVISSAARTGGISANRAMLPGTTNISAR